MLYFSKNHLWIKSDGTCVEIGLTDYAAEKLGNIVFVNLPDVGEALSEGERFGDVESVKTVSDLISPVDGEVVEVNETLLDEPEAISEDPFGKWLIKVRVESIPDGLVSGEEYKKFKETL